MKINIGKYNFSVSNRHEDSENGADTTERIKHKQTLIRSRQDLGTWRRANIVAENIDNPNRELLLRLYKDVDLDPHLSSLVTTRKNAILGARFIVVDKDNKENETLTALIERKWFVDFVDLALDSKNWGFSLIRFHDIIGNDIKEFEQVELIERRYVRPEFSHVSQTLHDSDAVHYLEDPYRSWNIGVGGKKDLGLYLKAAPMVLWKKGAMAAWAEFAELFGTPMRIGHTNTRDETTRQNMFDTLKNMGTSLFSVIDSKDKIEIIEGNTNSSGQDIFDRLIDRCNSELSKLFLGQTGTTDEKSFAGSANVHKQIFQSYNEADVIFIENVFTYQLIPMLIGHNEFSAFQNHKIKVVPDDELSLQESSVIDLGLLNHYDIDPEFIKQKYGTEVIVREDVNSVKNVQNRMNEYFKSKS